MAKRKKRAGKSKKAKSKKARDYVVVKSRSYGSKLRGTKIYFEGKKPKGLKKDGSISFGKHILEALHRKFGDEFRWIITQKTDSITLEREGLLIFIYEFPSEFEEEQKSSQAATHG